jgi:predicted cation transporter
MSEPVALVIVLLLLLGPVAWRRIEENIEAYFLLLGVLSTALAGALDLRLAAHAVTEATPISIAVVVAGMLFALGRGALDRLFGRLRAMMPRKFLVSCVVFAIASLSSVITAIVAALVLVEAVGLLHLEAKSRVRVAIAGCFAIGLGASLTPLGEPLSTLAASALRLGFTGLLRILGPWILPGMIVCAATAGVLARDDPAAPPRPALHVRESARDAAIQAVRVFIFVAGLVLISAAFGPLSAKHIGKLSDEALFWANSLSAVLDNATLVALEVHQMAPERAREAIIALLVSGGMLIPGNVPNIVAAGALRIRSAAWAKLAVPMGLTLMAGYFLALQLAR